MNVYQHARSRFDRLCHRPYSSVAEAWAIALGIDTAPAERPRRRVRKPRRKHRDTYDGIDECRAQTHGVDGL